MSRRHDHMYHVSEALCEVMEDIGVNEMLVMKRRRTWLLCETIAQATLNHIKREETYYYLGSQSEGSLTLGLESDVDILCSDFKYIVIQSIDEWRYGPHNFMMIQNENIAPGYCYLQPIRPDRPLPITVNQLADETFKHCAMDSEGRLLWESASALSFGTDRIPIHGAALTISAEPGVGGPYDFVQAFSCASSPHQVKEWLQTYEERKWPTEDVLKKCRTAGCFVVAVGSKTHSPDTDILESKLEWRISTCLQERYLMFSLNIIQIMCYILMKMILKTYINPHFHDVLTSFMCKNVLLYCVANSSQDWHTGNLLPYLHLCLFMLKECIERRNCPHFIIPENNLLAGRMIEGQRGKLLDIIDNLMADDEELLYKIQIDDLGRRLKIKLNRKLYCPNLASVTQISLMISVALVYDTASWLGSYISNILETMKYNNLEMVHQYLSAICTNLNDCKTIREDKLNPNTDINLLHTACDLLIPLVSSTQGSVLACIDVDAHTAISDQAFDYLEAGKESDALSGRLKLLSVLYCTGDMERAERELTIIQKQYIMRAFHTTCSCYKKALFYLKADGTNNFHFCNEKAIKSHVALCTRYLQCEINCVPHELRYELLRYCIEEDRQIRTDEDSWWMDFIVVDSIPYLYFLQYKVCGLQQRRIEQVQALGHLEWSIKFEPNLRHKETALNLYGQCLEKENSQTDALQCYIWSIKQRKRNNAARLLLCIQLLKLRKRGNMS